MYLQTPGPVKEVFFINQGRTRGTTFKIDTGGYVFSCLFDTGAEVSCMNVETCTALGLLHSVSDTNTQVNTASGQDMGIMGHVMVTFKFGKQSFTHKFLVCRFLTRPFILGEDYLSKNCMCIEWNGNKRAISCMSNDLAIASQEVMEEPLKLCNAIKIPTRSFVVAPTYCSQKFTGRVCARPSDELKHKFPNLSMEPIQFDNSEGKQQKEIHYYRLALDKGIFGYMVPISLYWN